jgi:hypothetical protein
MSLLAGIRRVAERTVRGDNGNSESSDGAIEFFTELPGILAIVGVVVALFSWMRRKHLDAP